MIMIIIMIMVMIIIIMIIEVISETKGSVWKIKKRALFRYKKIKKGILYLMPPMFLASLQLF